MRVFWLFLWLFSYAQITLAVSTASGNEQNHNKHAVLIGVGKYKSDTKWNPLNTQNDVLLLSETLQKKGFLKTHIHQLEDSKFNKSSLIETINTSLLPTIKKGDTVVFYYSGHGQQIVDDNGDETDGLDEALVPFDSPKNFKKGVYEGQKLVRDDLLNQIFTQIRTHLGPKGHLLVLVDACHSGTTIRGFGRARGSEMIMGKTKKRKLFNREKQVFIHQKTAASELASIVGLYSSSAQELSYEYQNQSGQKYGLMTYAFVRALENINKTSTYSDLLRQIRTFVRNHCNIQNPMLEGDQSMLVFGGNSNPTITSISAKDYLNPTTYLLESGLVQGIYPNSTLHIYAEQVVDTMNVLPLGKVQVRYAEALWSEVESDTPIDKATLMNCQFILSKRSFDFGKCQLAVDVAVHNRDALLEKLKPYHFIEINDTHPNIYIKSQGKRQIQILNTDRVVLWEGKKDQIEGVVSECLKDLYANYWKSLTQQDHRFGAAFDLLDVKTQKPKDAFVLGDEIMIKIQNKGELPFYFQLVGIQSNNVVVQIPFEGILSEELYLKPDDVFISSSFTISPPVGVEILKLVATPSVMDFEVMDFNDTFSRGGLDKFRIGTMNISTFSYEIRK